MPEKSGRRVLTADCCIAIAAKALPIAAKTRMLPLRTVRAWPGSTMVTLPASDILQFLAGTAVFHLLEGGSKQG